MSNFNVANNSLHKQYNFDHTVILDLLYGIIQKSCSGKFRESVFVVNQLTMKIKPTKLAYL